MQADIDLSHTPYAAAPGTGPAGETCATCGHCWRQRYKHRSVFKCKVLIEHWTFNPASDIRARSPACSQWFIKS